MSPETNIIDIAWSKPRPEAIVAAGYSGVIGYISHDPTKDLGQRLARAYVKAGLKVGLVFETTVDEAEHNAATGTADRVFAEQRAQQLGYPTDAPIFYGVDEDVDPQKVIDYFSGVLASNTHPSGPYGSIRVVDFLAQHHDSQVEWQAEAWSGTSVSSRASIYQRVGKNRPKVLGVKANAYDEDVILKPITLWGGELAPLGASTPPPPSPAQPQPPTQPPSATRLAERPRVLAPIITQSLAARTEPLDLRDRPVVVALHEAATHALTEV